MIRKTALALLTLLAAGLVPAAGSYLPASARSATPFRVEKNETGLRMEGTRESILHQGDTLASQLDAVQVSLRDGNSMMLDEMTRATFPGNGPVVLEDGAMILHRSEQTAPAIACENLTVAPISTAAEDSVLLVRKVSENEVRMTVARDSYAIDATTADGPTRLATIGDGDAIVLTRVGGIWNATFPLKSDSPADPQSPVTLGAINEDAEKVGFWWANGSSAALIGLLALGAGAGGYEVYDRERDERNDDNDDDGAGGGGGGGGGGTPISPMTPPQNNN